MKKLLYLLVIFIFAGCQNVSQFKSGSYLKNNFNFSVRGDGLIFYYNILPDGNLDFLIKNTSNMLVRNLDIEFTTSAGSNSRLKNITMLKNLGTRELRISNTKGNKSVLIKYRYQATPEDIFLKPDNRQREFIQDTVTGEVLAPLQ